MALDGSDERVLEADTSFFDYHYGREFGYPSVSPDGSTFLFRSHRSGWENTWMGNVDGSGEARPLAAASADQYDAVWSPTDRRSHTPRTTTGPSCCASRPPTALARSMASARLSVATRNPAWSPDGRQLAFLGGTPTSPNALWAIDLETGERRQLTQSVPAGLEEQLVTPEKAPLSELGWPRD